MPRMFLSSQFSALGRVLVVSGKTGRLFNNSLDLDLQKTRKASQLAGLWTSLDAIASVFGVPRRIRTAGLSLRRGPLYPAELSGL